MATIDDAPSRRAPGHADQLSMTPDPEIYVGAMIGGKFKVERIIGEGGMGLVVQARHLYLDECVALKFLRREVMNVPDVIDRFAQEARTVAKLKSEHVARVFDVGTRDDGVPYLVMEYLEGSDLSRVLAEQGPPSLAETARYIIEACDGLAEAHARGIVHRDIKLENLFLTRRPEGSSLIKILDFGISKVTFASGVDNPTHVSPRTIMVMGSPHYMSPEQLRSTNDVDHQTDIWALGVTMFELLSGQLPYDPNLQFAELCAQVLKDPPRSLFRLAPHVPVGLERVVRRCMEKERIRRYQSVAHVAAAVLPYAGEQARPLVDKIISICAAAGLCEHALRETARDFSSSGGAPSSGRSQELHAATPARAEVLQELATDSKEQPTPGPANGIKTAALEAFVWAPDVRGAAYGDRAGRLVASTGIVDPETLCAAVGVAIGALEHAGESAALGNLCSLTLSSAHSSLHVNTYEDEFVAVLANGIKNTEGWIKRIAEQLGPSAPPRSGISHKSAPRFG